MTFGRTGDCGDNCQNCYNSLSNRISNFQPREMTLYQQGIDHNGLTNNYQGLDSRLTGVGGTYAAEEIAEQR